MKKCLALKSDENTITEGETSIKAAEKDPNATVVAGIHLISVTVVDSINATEFWQWRTWYNYCFCDSCFCTSLLPSLICSIPSDNLQRN